MIQQLIKNISPSELLSETIEYKYYGYRLSAITCTKKDNLEITYSFSKEYGFIHLRLHIEDTTEIESISLVYPYSFLYENEIKELFGVNIKNISVDFDNNLYRIAVKTPFNMKKEVE